MNSIEKYQHQKIEKKWQDFWLKNKTFTIDKKQTKNKIYILSMFPYPSGSGLHMGHVKNFAITDVYSRFKKLKGFNVLHPIGFDSFGLPAENYAIKVGGLPKEIINKSIANFKKQMQFLGLGFDFSEIIETSSPNYYKFTQIIFLKFLEAGFVYKGFDKTNWCDSCKTIIANEQVNDGKCERCSELVIQKKVPGWFFKISDLSDDLINDLEKLDWPNSTKINQKNWIGKSSGALINFPIKDNNESIEIFTSRADTIFGVTYMVLSPEHFLLESLKLKINNWTEVEDYIKKTNHKTNLERVNSKEKTAVKLVGILAINPVNKKEISVFISDYVLADYGTGAIMAVPAHDDRDFKFATKFNLEIIQVINNQNHIQDSGIYSGNGQLINSNQFNGRDNIEALDEIIEYAGGQKKVNFKLKDWSISRQRYWGAPIPIVYNSEGEIVPIPNEHLPWELPNDVEFLPRGKSPLSYSKELKERVERIFGPGFTPEYDTMDTFVCSSWYYLRYPDIFNQNEICSANRLNWLPVDLYVGGAEHTVLHLMYARFFSKVLNKLKIIDFDEPFLKLLHQGFVLDKNGIKMSKSLGNIVSPDEIIKNYGADALRLYIFFTGPITDSSKWNTNNIIGPYRFLEKIWFLQKRVKKDFLTPEYLKLKINQSFSKIINDYQNLKFNVIVSELMILSNEFIKEEKINQQDFLNFLILLSPLAPHITQEIYTQLGFTNQIIDLKLPEIDKKYLIQDNFIISIQIDGKFRGYININKNETEKSVLNLISLDPQISKWLEGKKIKKTIYIKQKALSIVLEK